MPETQKDQRLSEETTKNRKLDKVFWFKVCISFLFGVSFGIFKLTGFLSFLG